MEESSIHQEPNAVTDRSAAWTIGHIVRFIQMTGIVLVFVLLTFGMLSWFGLLDAADTQSRASTVDEPNPDVQTGLNDAPVTEGEIITLQPRIVNSQVDRLTSSSSEEAQQPPLEPEPKATVLPTATPVPTVEATQIPTAIPTPIEEAKAVPLPQTNLPSNLRNGPGTVYSIVGSVQAGYPLNIIAQNGDGSWYQLDTKAWIAAFLVDNGPLDLPIAVEIPAPPLTQGE